MSKKTIKAVAAIVCLAMIVTTFSFMVFLPAAFGAEVQGATAGTYGATATAGETAKSSTADMTDEQKEELMVRRLNILLAYMTHIDWVYKDVVDLNVLLDGAFQGTTDALGDQFSEFFKTQEEKANFKNSVDGTFSGVGVVVSKGTDYPYITNIIEGSPAEKAGLKEGDKFKIIDGVPMAGESSAAASSRLRGDEGTSVTMTIIRNNQEMNFTIKRALLSEQTVYSYTYDEYPNLTRIRVASFDSDTATEFKRALKNIRAAGDEKNQNIILDLRGNGGGYTLQAEEMADALLEGVDITHYERQGKIFQTVKADDGEKFEGKVVVLVNGRSASASELLAAALKENGIKVVGTTTYGKGFAQELRNLADGNSFKLSTNYFLTPKKNNFSGVGITPDYVVRNTELTDEEVAAAREQYITFCKYEENVKPGLGDYNITVYAAQQRLNLLGYEAPLTGAMDAATVTAMKQFQKDSGLYPYAVLDMTTQTALDNAALLYVNGLSTEDYQMEKALELLGYKLN